MLYSLKDHRLELIACLPPRPMRSIFSLTCQPTWPSFSSFTTQILISKMLFILDLTQSPTLPLLKSFHCPGTSYLCSGSSSHNCIAFLNENSLSSLSFWLILKSRTLLFLYFSLSLLPLFHLHQGEGITKVIFLALHCHFQTIISLPSYEVMLF